MKGIAVPPGQGWETLSLSEKQTHANAWHSAGHRPRHTNCNHPREDLHCYPLLVDTV